MMLKVTDLACARGGMIVLQGISFDLLPGRALILKGANGSGKTTLLRTIAGLQPASSGQIDVPEDAVVYAAHLDGLKATLTVRENLTFWADIYRTDIADTLARMDLDGLADRPANTLSAGQKRRLGLARLLLTDRPVWLLDEPTVSLDAGSVTLFADVLRLHLTSGGMALIATHIDLGLQADILDLTPYRALKVLADDGFDEAFL